MKPFRRRAIRLLLVLALVVPGLLAPGVLQAQEDESMPYAARGPYAVGAREVMIDDGAGGSLAAALWYPALNPDAAPESTVYRYGILPLPGEALSDAAPDAANGPYPVVIFAHGYGGLRYQSLFLTEHLASWGVVVLAADYPGSNLATALTNPDAMLNGLVDGFVTRPLDLLRQVAYLDGLAADDPLFGVLDMERLAVMGHSFGGYTALAAAGARLDLDALAAWCEAPVVFDWPEDESALMAETIRPRSQAGRSLRQSACFLPEQAERLAELRGLDEPPAGPWPETTDPRLDAVVALAPYNVPALGETGMATLTVPALVLVGSEDTVTPPVRDAYAAYAWASSPDARLIELLGAGHRLFTDMCDNPLAQTLNLDLCGDDENSTWQRDYTAHLVTTFLLRVFDNDASLDGLLDTDTINTLDGVAALGRDG